MTNKKIINKALLLLLLTYCIGLIPKVFQIISLIQVILHDSRYDGLGRKFVISYGVSSLIEVVISVICVMIIVILISLTNKRHFMMGIVTIMILNFFSMVMVLIYRLLSFSQFQSVVEIMTTGVLLIITFLLTQGTLLFSLVLINLEKKKESVTFLIISTVSWCIYLIYRVYVQWDITQTTFFYGSISIFEYCYYLYYHFISMIYLAVVWVLNHLLLKNTTFTYKKGITILSTVVIISFGLYLLIHLIIYITEGHYNFNDQVNDFRLLLNFTTISIGVIATIIGAFIPVIVLKDVKEEY